jgi:hypothetical protein
MLNSELRLLLILIKENVKRFYSVILDSLYLVGVESCELMKKCEFSAFLVGFGNASESNTRNSYHRL